MITALYSSIVRTLIPLLVAAVVTYATKVGLDVDSAALSSLLGGVVGSAYYIVVRLIETKFPKFTWLLGSASQPNGYSDDGK